MKDIRIIFPTMYALYGNIKAYYCIVMHNYSLNMKNCLNYANFAIESKLDLFRYFFEISVEVSVYLNSVYM